MKIAEHGPDLASLQELVDSVPALIHTARPDGAIDFFNQRWLEFVGLRLEDLEGWKWTAAVHPDDVSALVAKWRACLASGEPLECESRVRRADGAYRWMWHQKLPLRNASGEIVKWYGSSVDIDDRKRADEKRTEAEFYLAEGQRLAHTGSWAFNAAGFDYWSPELFAIHGLAPGGQAPTIAEYVALVHPEDRGFVAHVIQKILSDHRGFDFTKRIVRPDGDVRYVRCVGAPVIEGGPQTIVGTAIDVTEHKLAEEALRESEAALLEAQRLTHAGSWRHDVSLGTVTVTPEVHRIFAISPDEDASTADFFFDRIHPEDRAAEFSHYAKAQQTKRDFQSDYRIVLPDGSVRYIHNIGHPVVNESDEVTAFVGTTTDVTEHVEARTELEQASAALRASEAEFRQMLDFTPQCIGVIGADGSPLYANRASLDYIGMNLDEWRQSSALADFAHPDDLPRIIAEGNRAAGSAYELELRVRGGDGIFRWFLSRFNPLHDDNGQVKTWFIASTDIEDRKRAEEKLQQENVALREEIDKASMFEEIVGASSALKALLSRVSKVAGSDSTVLITGETGTGKELVARAIHRRSRRASRAFVAVNCAAIPRDLIASELFGHEKGAFTGAVQRQLGRFELADGGTMFLDEVGELSSEMQVTLLRVLQERQFERVGGRQPIHVDVRVIAATNRDLPAAVAGGTFRQDLFYRLNVFPLEMPPLRDRREDIPVLVEYFVDRYARKAGKTIRRVNKRTLDRLQSYPWPGNVRELQNVIERSVIVCDTDEFTVDESWLSAPAVESPHALSSTLAGHEKAIVEDALRASRGRVFGPSGAAARLGIARSTLESKIRALGINKNRFRGRPAKP